MSGLANLFGPVKRFKQLLLVRWIDLGSLFELRASGLLARIIQHEIDHLSGIVF